MSQLMSQSAIVLFNQCLTICRPMYSFDQDFEIIFSFQNTSVSIIVLRNTVNQSLLISFQNIYYIVVAFCNHGHIFMVVRSKQTGLKKVICF